MATDYQAMLHDAVDTRRLVIGADAIAGCGAVFIECFPGRPAVVIADATTWHVVGAAVAVALRAAGVAVLDGLVFPAEPQLHPDWTHVEEIGRILAAGDAVPVAVGAGTINDLVKLAAHHHGRPYLVVATAASMDGYAASGASILKDGAKQTFPCPAPRAIVADPGMIGRAPAELTAAGYADLLAKIVAGADWILAEELGIEAIVPSAWQLAQAGLRGWIGSPERLAAGEAQASADLLLGLVSSGLAMQAARSSRPASGADHQFSHLWDMEGCGLATAHGFKVGIGSILSATLYERLLATDLDAAVAAARSLARPGRDTVAGLVDALHIHPAIRCVARTETLAKYTDQAGIANRLDRLRCCWPRLSERLAGQLLPAARIRGLLQAIGAPVTVAAIAVADDGLTLACRRARSIRRRYTILDLAGDLGLDDAWFNSLEGAV